MGERLSGVRTPYAAMPGQVRAWVDEQLGSPVATVLPRTGGMSPAVAATVVAEDGSRRFVKAVSADINPDTPSHFRHEIGVLTRIGPAPYRSRLLASYDDGHWVALLLEDVEGSHPDWDDPVHVDAVFDAVMTQAAELTPLPGGDEMQTVSQAMDRHRLTLEAPTAEQRAALPGWAQRDYADLVALISESRDRIDGQTLCHWDIRYDNLLVRDLDRQVVMVDWGMSRRGPWWGDVMVLGLEWVETPFFDDLLDRAGLDAGEQQTATGFLAALGSYLVIASTFPAPPGLPHLPAFREELGGRCLVGVRRRLDLPRRQR